MPLLNEIIDLRSDTVTKPCPAMRKVMSEAVVGDDVYREDPTVNELEEYAAKLFGKEAALFVPTGTMGNLISVMAHCDRRAQEVLLGDQSHIHMFEQGGIAQVAGVHHRTLVTNEDGTFDINEIKNKIRHGDDCHIPQTGLICLENSHNLSGGTVLPLSYLEKVYNLAKTHNIPIHTDGARIMNASVFLGVPPSTLLKYSDSVSACLSKGLCAPAGTIIAGTKDFIAKSIRYRKLLGGGMRQVGVLAAAGLFSFKHLVERLSDDHKNAKNVAKSVHELGSKVVSVDLDKVQTNIVNLKLSASKIVPTEFCKRLNEVTHSERDEIGEDIYIKASPGRRNDTVRIVFHADISSEQTEKVIKKIRHITKELD